MVDIIRIIIKELNNINAVIEVDPETSYKFELEKDTIVSQLKSLVGKNDVVIFSIDIDFDIRISDCYDMKSVILKIRNHYRKKKSFKKTLRNTIINKITDSSRSEDQFNKFNNDRFIDLIHKHIIVAMESIQFTDFVLNVKDNSIEIIILGYHKIILSL